MSSSRKTEAQLGSRTTIGRRGLDFREKFVHDLEEQALGAIEHADVVERTPAAQVSARNADVEAGGLEHFDGSFGGRGEEVVVECVGPEEDGVILASLRSDGTDGRGRRDASYRRLPTIV